MIMVSTKWMCPCFNSLLQEDSVICLRSLMESVWKAVFLKQNGWKGISSRLASYFHITFDLGSANYEIEFQKYFTRYLIIFLKMESLRFVKEFFNDWFGNDFHIGHDFIKSSSIYS